MARPQERPRLWRRGAPVAVALLAALFLVQATGCSCRSETPAERQARLAKEEAERIEREKKEEEEKRLRQPVQLPPAKMMPAGEETLSTFVKPGHWNAVLQTAQANAKDFDGVITYEVVGAKGALALERGAELRLVSRRPLVVAAKSIKAVDALFYCPHSGANAPRLKSTVRDRRTGAVQADSGYATPLRRLLAHQYHFVVLAAEPQRYGFLKALRSVDAPLEDRIETDRFPATSLKPSLNYRVVAVPTDDPSGEVALPDNPLAWTSIAYLLWDEVDPEVLRPAQREAIIDWINWGGQLIVNGADFARRAPRQLLGAPPPRARRRRPRGPDRRADRLRRAVVRRSEGGAPRRGRRLVGGEAGSRRWGRTLPRRVGPAGRTPRREWAHRRVGARPVGQPPPRVDRGLRELHERCALEAPATPLRVAQRERRGSPSIGPTTRSPST